MGLSIHTAFPPIFEANAPYLHAREPIDPTLIDMVDFLVKTRDKIAFDIMCEYAANNALYSLYQDGSISLANYSIMYQTIIPKITEGLMNDYGKYINN
jgi:hypothetical protein